jgi:hypothetical protein
MNILVHADSPSLFLDNLQLARIRHLTAESPGTDVDLKEDSELSKNAARDGLLGNNRQEKPPGTE